MIPLTRHERKGKTTGLENMSVVGRGLEVEGRVGYKEA